MTELQNWAAFSLTNRGPIHYSKPFSKKGVHARPESKVYCLPGVQDSLATIRIRQRPIMILFSLRRILGFSCTAPSHRSVLTLHLENGPAGNFDCFNNGPCRQSRTMPAPSDHFGIESQPFCNNAA